MQASFDDLGTPLDEVTFCVVDLETTGGRAEDGGITEIGAARYRGGELLGTFRTFVDPGTPIPREITHLTGITTAMVTKAPPIDAVLPTLLEFMGDAVIVGHNVGYDTRFLDAALEASGRPRLPNRTVDTLALARRLVRDEVPNCRLGTLADHLRLPNRPCHRALDDVLATGDLLHLLLDRAGRLGVTGLDDLLGLPRMGGHPQAGKLRLTDDLPRTSGVYLFRNGTGDTLYVGKATNLRSRVRSYFSGDDRRKIGRLLRETQRIDHVVCSNTLEAEVLEIRLIQRLEPHYNRQLRNWRRYVYLRLTDEPLPRLSIVRRIDRADVVHLGPLPSHRMARTVADAIETALPLRRCTGRPGRPSAGGTCSDTILGRSPCPCDGSVSPEVYASVVEELRRGIHDDPSVLLEPLRMRMDELAAAERFEAAADLRDQAAALASALRRQQRIDRLRRAGTVHLDLDGSGGAEIRRGRLVRAWRVTRGGVDMVPLPLEPAGEPDDGETEADTALPTSEVDEVLCIARWLERHRDRITIEGADAPPLAHGRPIPTFQPAAGRTSGLPESRGTHDRSRRTTRSRRR